MSVADEVTGACLAPDPPAAADRLGADAWWVNDWQEIVRNEHVEVCWPGSFYRFRFISGVALGLPLGPPPKARSFTLLNPTLVPFHPSTFFSTRRPLDCFRDRFNSTLSQTWPTQAKVQPRPYCRKPHRRQPIDAPLSQTLQQWIWLLRDAPNRCSPALKSTPRGVLVRTRSLRPGSSTGRTVSRTRSGSAESGLTVDCSHSRGTANTHMGAHL